MKKLLIICEGYIIPHPFRVGLLICIFACWSAGQLFALGTLELVNSDTLDMDMVQTLNIAYGSDNIVLMESPDNNLTLKEFMTRNRPEYYAKMENTKDTITINSGRRPWFIRTRIELYIPKILTENVSVSLGSGNLTVNYHMRHHNITLAVSSGNIRTNTITSKNVLAEVSSGNIRIDELDGIDLTVRNKSGTTTINNCRGTINAVNNSGNIKIGHFSGDGAFEVSSGSISVNVDELTGNAALSAGSGNIDMLMGKNASFILDAETGSGNIRAPNLHRQVNTQVRHTVGIDPVYTITARCGSGNITIKPESL